MNQILSVEMPKNSANGRKSHNSQKASLKSVLIFFGIVLILFGIALLGVGLYLKLGNNNNSVVPTDTTNKPRIDIIQNASQLEIDISSENQIASVQYKWNDEEYTQGQTNGTNSVTINIDSIPAGTNTLTVIAKDINGISTEYSNQYVGDEEAKVGLRFDKTTGVLTAISQEEKIVKSIAYSYDDGEEVIQDIDADSQVPIEIKQGEHDLNIRVIYEDGTTKQRKQKIYFPVVDINRNSDYTKFEISASDVRNITKVIINFNGQETEEEVNATKYTKQIELQAGEPGSNKLICTIYNGDGVAITKRIWDIDRNN